VIGKAIGINIFYVQNIYDLLPQTSKPESTVVCVVKYTNSVKAFINIRRPVKENNH